MNSFAYILKKIFFAYIFLQKCMHLFIGGLPRSVITGPKFMCGKVYGDYQIILQRHCSNLYTSSIMYVNGFRVFFLSYIALDKHSGWVALLLFVSL